jgi:3-oxoacyl-[acyl-carrier protein] reductase
VSLGLTYPTDASRETKEDIWDAVIRLTHLGRLATPQDIVGEVLFFAFEWATFIPGQFLRVNGGWVIA